MLETQESIFRIKFAESIFQNKYKHEGCETWEALSETLIRDVCGNYLTPEEREQLAHIHSKMQFIAGGRYLYYAGRGNKFFNNCYLLKAEKDTREDWAELSWKAQSCLMTGGGIGVDYSVYRPKGSIISRTGGFASGPVSVMKIINEIGREVMQGGSRRSAMYASLNWLHGDSEEFLHVKDWYNMPVKGTSLTIGELKELDFNYPAPLDMTNISLNYDNKFLDKLYGKGGWYEANGQIKTTGEIKSIPTTFIHNCQQALKTGEPGFSFNFGSKEKETLRNACTEVSSEDDSDVCNLGSLNMANFDTIEEFAQACYLGSKFLYCGTLVADVPYNKIAKVRARNRRLGLGLMGVHEWLLKRNYRYEVTKELHEWLQVYKDESERGANELADDLGMNRPVAYRAIAPTGTIGIMACTTTGIEPLYAVAYKRRYLKNKDDWHYQFVVDGTAKYLIEHYNLDPNTIEAAVDLAADYERRIKFQADVQDYVDMSISSTINLPNWGSMLNNESMIPKFAATLAKYAHRLRGFTCYPNGARGGQPLEAVAYQDAIQHEGVEYKEHDICEIGGKGGVCGT